MRLLAIVGHCCPPRGGAQLTALTFLRLLRLEQRMECKVVTPSPVPWSGVHRGIRIRAYQHVEELRRIVEKWRPDAILSSLEESLDGVRVASRFGLPFVVYLHSFEYCAPSAEEIESWGVSSARCYMPEALSERILRGADLLASNSRFLGSRFEQMRGVDPRVLYPPFEAPRSLARARLQAKAITAIAGHRYKGARIVLDLAERFPHERFLVAGELDPALAPEFARRPNVETCGWIPTSKLLSRSRVVLVPSQWPEPFGRIAVEAMSHGIPTLVSGTGGLPEIVGTTPLGLSDFRNPEAWREQLGSLLASARLQSEFAAVGRLAAAPFLKGDSVRELGSALVELCGRKRPNYGGPRRVLLEGATSRPTAYCAINERWSEALASSESVRLVPSSEASWEAPDVALHHDFEVDFGSVEFPDMGRLAVVRTWDFGPFPRAWVKKINEECDQLWVYSRWIREQALAGGVVSSKIAVVPLGIDERIFHPEGPAFALSTRKSFRFLFVGAPVVRKGFDILLAAYTRAFGPADDVCLVVKDHSNNVFYSDGGLRQQLLRMREDPELPEIEYIDEYLPAERVAALLRACDFGVFPYRAEGFCLPILEAMGAGLPAIVPRFGASLDYCTRSTSIQIPARRISLPVGGRFAFNSMGFTETVEEVDFCEVGVDTLVEALRQARALGETARLRLAKAGVERAHSRFRWSNSAARVQALLERLGQGAVPCRVQKKMALVAKEAERIAAARALYAETLH